MASLVLFLATVGLWIRSYYVRDILHFGRDRGDAHTAQSLLGRLHILSWLDVQRSGGESTYQADRLSPYAIWNGGMSNYPHKVQWRLGFIFQRYDHESFDFSMTGASSVARSRHRLIVIPYWAPALVFAVVPLAWIAGTRSRNTVPHSEPTA
jgi:hypothetical protein